MQNNHVILSKWVQMQSNQVILSKWSDTVPHYPSEIFDAVITDPPYGVTKDADDYIATDFLPEMYRVLKPNSALFMCVGQATIREFWNAAEAAGFKWLNTIVWYYKNAIKRERKRFAIQYDPVLYFAKGDFQHNIDNVRVPYLHPERLKYPCNNDKKQGWMPNPLGAICGDVWDIPAVNAGNPHDRQVGHKWQKPMALFDRMIKSCTTKGDLILDPFCGSGTSLVCAKENEVDYIGIDCDPAAVDIARKRLAGELPISKNNRKHQVAKGKLIFDEVAE